jgi:hypothetical protein
MMPCSDVDFIPAPGGPRLAFVGWRLSVLRAVLQSGATREAVRVGSCGAAAVHVHFQAPRNRWRRDTPPRLDFSVD